MSASRSSTQVFRLKSGKKNMFAKLPLLDKTENKEISPIKVVVDDHAADQADQAEQADKADQADLKKSL